MEHRVSNDSKIVAASLLTDIRLTGMMYALIKLAANNVYTSEKVYTNEDTCHVCAYRDGEFAIKREIPCTPVLNRTRIEYHPEDLTIVGGMALALYDNAIRHIKKVRGLGPLKDFLTKNTSDIDMVWWPRTYSKPGEPKEIVTIHSPAIKEHVEQFKKALESKFSRRNNIQTIMKLIPHAKSLQIRVTQTDLFIAGVNHIHIYFIITYRNDTTIQIEICDIAIHDSGSSQLTIGPQKRAILSPMENDPMYVSQTAHDIHTVRIGRIKLNVPIISRLIDQQLLAFSNLLKKNDNKCIINYKRLRYIQKVLAPTNVHRPTLLAAFGISKYDVYDTIARINIELDNSISQQCNRDTRELCMKLQEMAQQPASQLAQASAQTSQPSSQASQASQPSSQASLQRALLESVPHNLPPHMSPEEWIQRMKESPFMSRDEIKRMTQQLKQSKGGHTQRHIQRKRNTGVTKKRRSY